MCIMASTKIEKDTPIPVYVLANKENFCATTWCENRKSGHTGVHKKEDKLILREE